MFNETLTIAGQRMAYAERFDLHRPIDQQPQDRHAHAIHRCAAGPGTAAGAGAGLVLKAPRQACV